VNTVATVYLPANNAAQVMEGDKALSLVKEIRVEGKEEGYVVLKVGSGRYQFTW
jgi:alpha-L-rhamnosidase